MKGTLEIFGNDNKLLLSVYVYFITVFIPVCSSTTSMTTTSTTSRHDPDLLRSEVSQARGRVAQLRKELRQARAEVASARRGVDTLTELVFLHNTL